MQYLSESELSTLVEIGLRNDFLILGEIHGSKQNALLVKKLVELFAKSRIPITLALEWAISKDDLKSIKVYTAGGAKPKLSSSFFLDSDGRTTYEHFELLKHIRTLNQQNAHNEVGKINLCTFENESNCSTEQDLASSLELCKALYPGNLIVVETGNYHARKLTFDSNITSEPTLATMLSEKYMVYSVLIKYNKGTVRVEGAEVDVTKAFSQRAAEERYFDAVLTLSSSGASDNPVGLQFLQDIL